MKKLMSAVCVAVALFAAVSANAQQAGSPAQQVQQVTIKSISVQAGELLMVNGVACVVQITPNGPVIAPAQAAAVSSVAQPQVVAAQQPGYVVQQAPQVYAQQPQVVAVGQPYVVQQGPTMGDRFGSAARSAVGGAAQGAIYESMTGGKAGKGAAAGAVSGVAGNVLGQGLDALLGKDKAR